jgi:hypothetical protein
MAFFIRKENSQAIVTNSGWATHGGYSPFEPNYGMGVDQILSAKVVDQSGSIVDAAPEMLEVIRGGTRLTGKTLPLS